MNASTIKALEKLPSLAGVSRSIVSQLAAVSGIQRAGKGSRLFNEGEHAHFIYCLIEGVVALQSGSPGNETIIDFMQAGDMLLIPPALLDLPYMVSAQAITNLAVVIIPLEEFRRLANSEISLSRAINRLLSAHWRLLLRHLTQARTSDVDTRLKDYLTDLAGKAKGPARVALPGTKKEVAAHLGMTPETLSRSLKRLGSLGVRTQHAEIRIEEISRLAPKAEKRNFNARQYRAEGKGR